MEAKAPPLARVAAEWLTIALCGAGLAATFFPGWAALIEAGPLWIAAGLLALPPSILLADVFTGTVHFLADRFFHVDTPVIGEGFLRRFRIHHIDPGMILRLPMREIIGAATLLAAPMVAILVVWGPLDTPLGALLTASVSTFILFSLATNLFHRWAHDPEPPAIIRPFQRYGLVLSAPHHKVHHTPPFDKHYCITCGWINPFLDRVGFFRGLERALVALGLPRSPPEDSEVEPIVESVESQAS